MFTDDKPYHVELGDPYELMMKSIPSNSIDLVITCPNYNVRIKKTVSHLYRIVKTGSVVVWITGDAENRAETGASFEQVLAFLSQGFVLHDTMIWRRLSQVTSKLRYHPAFEYMFVFSKEVSPNHVNLIKDRAVREEFLPRENIWSYESEGAKVLPVALVTDHVLSWSKEGDIIFDPFLKFGAVGVATLRANRRFIGFERNKDYFKIAEKRILNWDNDNYNNINSLRDDLYEIWSD